jgi:P-type Ca2+ transporter type 2C
VQTDNLSMTHGAHALDSHEVKRRLEVDPNIGLHEQHVIERRARHGRNVLPQVRSRRLTAMIVDQFTNIIVVLLGVAAAISWFTHEHAQAMAIAVVLLINALVGFATEWQSDRALDALRKQTRMTVSVRRGGQVTTIPAEELTVGDIVLLAPGDRVPADLRVIEAAGLQAEEAALTGESRGVNKSVEAVAADTPLAERSSMLYLGTIITAGRGVGVVVATGEETELGRIGRLVTGIDDAPSTLQRKLQQLGHRLVYLVLAIAVVVIITGWMRGDPLWEMVEVGISLAVAAVPEALPAVTTFILAFGVLRMARRHAIVRRLAAVETLGSTTVICCDKTGTLTLNQMTVVANETPDIAAAARVAALCNEAAGRVGDPTEVALLAWAESTGIDVQRMRSEYPRVREFPFDPRTKRMVTVHRAGDACLWALKGAPSVVLDACRLSDGERQRIVAHNEQMAGRGLRVLALAEKQTSAAADDSPYTFLGLVGLTDPPRSGVLESLNTARQAGIRVIMLTGDQATTARTIGRELGLAEGDVYARVSPEQKFEIVKDLQGRGEIVAVTGDGVNDAPALKKADVGVAMGMRGTEVAKEASDIVLADDNFATIVSAIEGGRNIYANIVRFVHLMFSHNLGEVLTIFVALVIGWPLPLLPLQILWVNLATDIFPAFGLALEPGSPEVMRTPPRDPLQPIFSPPLMLTIAWQGAMLATITLATYGWALRTYGEGAHARTVALFAMICVQVGHTFNCRSRLRSAFHGLTRNPYLWVAVGILAVLQVLVLKLALLSRILGLTQVSAADGLAFAIAIVAPVVIVEIQKSLARRRLTRRG